MKVTCEIKDYSHPAQSNIKIHNTWSDGKRYRVDEEELISAIKKEMLDVFGR